MAVQLENDLFIRACFCRETNKAPVWLIRQAGRYLPEDRKTRSKAESFLDLAKHPDFATEVTLQPIDRFNLDLAILFSDILKIPDAMGLELSFQNSDGPRFSEPLTIVGGSQLGGYIFNLGHGISQFMPPENIAALVSMDRQCSANFRVSTV